MKNPTYEDLVYQLQTGDISYLDFVCKQEDIVDDYARWCKEKELQQSETTAELYIVATEKAMMDSFM